MFFYFFILCCLLLYITVSLIHSFIHSPNPHGAHTVYKWILESLRVYEKENDLGWQL